MHILNFVHNNSKVEFLGNGDVYFLHRTIKKHLRLLAAIMRSLFNIYNLDM